MIKLIAVCVSAGAMLAMPGAALAGGGPQNANNPNASHAAKACFQSDGKAHFCPFPG